MKIEAINRNTNKKTYFICLLILFMMTSVFLFCFSGTVQAADSRYKWGNLSKGQQRILNQYKKNWESFQEARKEKLFNGSKKWLQMSSKERKTLLKKIQEWENLPKERQKKIQQG